MSDGLPFGPRNLVGGSCQTVGSMCWAECGMGGLWLENVQSVVGERLLDATIVLEKGLEPVTKTALLPPSLS